MTTARRRIVPHPDRWGSPALAAALVVGVLAVLLTAAAHSSHPFPQPPEKTHTSAPSSVPPQPATVPRNHHKSNGGDDGSLVVLLASAVLLLIAVALLMRYLRRPAGLRLPVWGLRARAPAVPAAQPAQAELEEVAAVIDDALERDAGARSIIECWTALERSLAGLGHPRQPAETSTAYVERVLAVYGIAPEPPRRLGALYREARFSRHELSAAAGESAHEALRALRKELGAVARET